MDDLQYTHEQMVNLLDDAKRIVLLEVEEKVRANFGQKLGDFTLISQESVLKDIEIVRLDNGIYNE